MTLARRYIILALYVRIGWVMRMVFCRFSRLRVLFAIRAAGQLASAQAWADADPYAIAGVYARVTVKPFKKVLP